MGVGAGPGLDRLEAGRAGGACTARQDPGAAISDESRKRANEAREVKMLVIQRLEVTPVG
jgi:hypothetical protein